MKFAIKHEIKGRIRIHLAQKQMQQPAQQTGDGLGQQHHPQKAQKLEAEAQKVEFDQICIDHEGRDHDQRRKYQIQRQQGDHPAQ